MTEIGAENPKGEPSPLTKKFKTSLLNDSLHPVGPNIWSPTQLKELIKASINPQNSDEFDINSAQQVINGLSECGLIIQIPDNHPSLTLLAEREKPEKRYQKILTMTKTIEPDMNYKIGYVLDDIADAKNYVSPIVINTVSDSITALTLLKLVEERLMFNINLLNESGHDLAFKLKDILSQNPTQNGFITLKSDLSLIKAKLDLTFVLLEKISSLTVFGNDQDSESEFSRIHKIFTDLVAKSTR